MSELSRVVCPLCPLHCDDVVVNADGSVRANGCEIAESAGSLVNQVARTDEAILARIAACKQPIRVITSGVDLVAARQLVQWQSDGVIEVEIESDPSLQAIGTVTRRDGIVAATLSEVVTHADLVWLIGEVDPAWPRLEEKLRLESAVSSATHGKRQVKRWERWTADFAGRMHHAIEHLDTTEEGSEFQTRGKHFHESSYAAIVIGPGAFDADEAEMTAAMVARITRRRNESARCVCVTLDPAATLRSVHAWQTNESLASIVSDSETDSTPVIRLVGIGHRMSDDRSVDLQIGGCDPGVEHAKAFMPASPWADSMVIRGDGSVTLPLQVPAALSVNSPTAIEQLQTVLPESRTVVPNCSVSQRT
ncbi:molybdopterin-binding domain-containing protein [Rhodopirellula baltica]|uniref:Formylmethanofuran dehydrogenase subunit B n=1 Tax=Rhodopirellula baltica WH47 TaxID=991778 RepID=F2ATB1_RHOBT|nr:hypothetical protein [Rhodopirellula baltica]EGF27107.1 hypothetical protein RBWH47_04116 [Rhodopirellula baltica WH47]